MRCVSVQMRRTISGYMSKAMRRKATPVGQLLRAPIDWGAAGEPREARSEGSPKVSFRDRRHEIGPGRILAMGKSRTSAALIQCSTSKLRAQCQLNALAIPTQYQCNTSATSLSRAWGRRGRSRGLAHVGRTPELPRYRASICGRRREIIQGDKKAH